MQNTNVNNTFAKRLKTMIAVDMRRMFTMPLFYIMIGISLVIPILILVMTTAMDGTVSVNPQTGVETAVKGFDNVWQILGSLSSSSASMEMGLTTMCNINMMFFFVAVFVCVFVADDFRSGYAKNLFTVRAKKFDYILSKFIVCFIAGASMLIAFFIGAMIGGKIAGLTFALNGATAGGIVMSMLSKIFLISMFVAIYLIAAAFAKQSLWLSLILSFGIGMLFFTMTPMISPLDSTIINVLLCLVGSGLFSSGFLYLSTLILTKRDIL